jgi:hypothetical protein
MDAAKRTPRFHYDVDGRRKGRSRGFAKSLKRQADGEERLSVKRVDAIRRQLPSKDQRLIDLFLQEGGNYSVARRLKRHRTAVSDSFSRLFHRIKASADNCHNIPNACVCIK